MDDGHDALNEIDRLLAEALDVEVSPDFAARVRQRIARRPRRAPFWSGWAVAAAAAVLMFVAAGLAVISRQRGAGPSLIAARTLPRTQPVPADVRPGPPPRVNGISANHHAPRVHAVSSAAIGPAQAEVLVPREEIEMYRRLMAAAGQMPPGVVVDARPVAVVVEPGVAAIAIEPIRIELMAPPAGAEGERQ